MKDKTSCVEMMASTQLVLSHSRESGVPCRGGLYLWHISVP
ncbi:hypothetical protein [Porphyromonas cangingivalis]|nr:hypothetical protein [Porphyromonas cangingivalis]